MSLLAQPAHAFTEDVPLLADTNPDADVFEATLTADELNKVVKGPGTTPAQMYAFNGMVPGPEIRVKVGDRVKITVVNMTRNRFTPNSMTITIIRSRAVNIFIPSHPRFYLMWYYMGTILVIQFFNTYMCSTANYFFRQNKSHCRSFAQVVSHNIQRLQKNNKYG